MWSYFFPSNVSSCQSSKKPEEDTCCDWVFVDISGKVIEEEVAKMELKLDDDSSCKKRISPVPFLNVSNMQDIQITPPLSPSKTEDDWFITPPPCFTLDCPTKIEISPLEDLLIEHPSMSVYGHLPGFPSRKDKLKEIILKPTSKLEKTRRPAVKLDDAEPRTIANQKSSNQHPQEPQSSIYLKSQNIKDMFEQVENIRPAQQAKYLGEQFQLQPSYIKRQNRVHNFKNRYNQKKSRLMKPFGEKCKHGF